MNRSPFAIPIAARVLLVVVAALVAVGLASVYVSDTHYSTNPDGPRNAIKQTFFSLFSLACGVFVLRIGYAHVVRHVWAIAAVAIVGLIPLLAARFTHSTFGGLIAPRNGAYRWICLPGFQLQPAEFAKLAYLLVLAVCLSDVRRCRRLGSVLAIVAGSIPPIALILLEPDLGMSLLMLLLLMTMLYLGGARHRHLALLVLAGVAVVPLAWPRLEGYQRLRITGVLLQSEPLRRAIIADPEKYQAIASRRDALEWAGSSGYQLVQSKNALGSGGLTGHGWGEGPYVEHGWLPDRHNDFIFAMIGHQWGFIGCTLVLMGYVAITFAGLSIAREARDPTARLLALGVVALIDLQVIINVGMSIGLLPTTGMTLPFVSRGGSSVLVNFLAVSLLISVVRHQPYVLHGRTPVTGDGGPVHPADRSLPFVAALSQPPPPPVQSPLRAPGGPPPPNGTSSTKESGVDEPKSIQNIRSAPR